MIKWDQTFSHILTSFFPPSGNISMALNLNNSPKTSLTSGGKSKISPSHLTVVFSLAILIFTTLSIAHPLKAADQKANSNIALIYDLSKSMWARIGETPRVTIAQTAINNALKPFDKKINFGLIAFGHSQKDSCSNIETISKLGSLNASAIKAAIAPLRPRGNAPIGKALQAAANLAGNRTNPFSIILLSDGPSNCPMDPCQIAENLKTAAPNLTIDIVAIGTKTDTDLNQLSCITKPSKGTITYANSLDDITNALNTNISRAIKRAKPITVAANTEKEEQLGKISATPKGKEPTSEAEKKARGVTPITSAEKKTLGGEKKLESWAGATEIVAVPIEKTVTGTAGEKEEVTPTDKFSKSSENGNTHGGLALVASLIVKGQPIKNGVIWRIYNEKPNKATGKHQLISAHRTAEPVMSLPANTYLVNAAYGRAFLTRKIKIEPGQNKTETFILNAGGLRVATVLANGNPVADNTVVYDIFSDDRDQFGKRLKILGKVRPGLVVRLNAGIYHLVSTYGDANAQSRADVSVEAGKLTEASIDHLAAKVTFKLVYQKGGEALAGTTWSLLSPRGDIIKKTAGALPTHYLAGGEYTILAERGKEKYSQDFIIKPGDTSQIEVIIQ